MATDPESVGEDADEPQLVEVVGGGDWFLEQIIRALVSNGLDIGVTLTVGGSFISGDLISGSKYFDEISETIRGSAEKDGDLLHTIADGWKSLKKIYEKPEGAPEDWVPPPIGYVHLRNARLFVPGEKPIPTKGVLWRARLTSIEAFSLGKFMLD